jgi:PKD repeat protein
MKLAKKELTLLAAVMLLANLLFTASVQAVAASSMYIMLYINQTTAFVGKDEVQLDVPATIIDGHMFVPAKFLGDTLGFKVQWNGSTRTIDMEPPGYSITLDSDHNKVTVNGTEMPFDSVAAIINGRLLVKLIWVADYMGANYTYNDELKRVEMVYVKKPEGIYIDTRNNSKPVAKFTTAKPSYRIGEPVKYVDLSYDPDAEGIASYEWHGNQEAFFAPGKYAVTLQVTDGHGHKSDPYTQYVVVENKPYLTEFEYPLYMKPVGGFIKTNWSMIYGHFANLPELPKKVTQSDDRKLLVSDSPEEITQKGILYQDTINGKARLYADHVNGTKDKMTMAILATNNTDKPVTIKTTNKGEVFPSVYANLIGNEASVDFLMHNSYDDTLVVPPKQTLVYSQMPDFYPGQGVNLFYDIETDGELQISFVATPDRVTADTLKTLPLLSYVANVRGSFPVSDLSWDIDATTFTKPSRLILGDGKSDPFIAGYDTLRKKTVTNDGNYGVFYHIHADHPRKMVILIMARGGPFKGPFKINGEFVMVPQSGVLTAFDGVQVLARTTGTEDSLDIEYTPPAGSGFPADLIFYPLEDLK